VQAVLAMLLTSIPLHPVFSEQVVLALLETFALSALAALFVDLPSPARATGSEARQANVKQTMNFFITVSVRSFGQAALSGTIVKADQSIYVGVRGLCSGVLPVSRGVWPFCGAPV